MDVTPTTTTSTKRSRTKVVANEPTATKRPRKTLTTSPKRSKNAGAASPPTDDLHSMIETAAFYLAAERSFAPGHELEDWLEAERRIKALHPV